MKMSTLDARAYITPLAKKRCDLRQRESIPSHLLSCVLQVFLGDPASSSLCSYVASGSLTPSAGSTIAEGVGIGRLTANFKEAHVRSIEKAFTVTDQELLDMAYYLLRCVRMQLLWVLRICLHQSRF